MNDCARYGDFPQAAQQAAGCPDFRRDSEDECIAAEEISCYNCRYRRWLPQGYTCMKGYDA